MSPFLWIILVDDLLRCCFPFRVIMVAYADDITVGVSNKDPKNSIKHAIRHTVTGLAVLAKKRTNCFFFKLKFYCCTDLHATYKLAPGGNSSLCSESPKGGSQSLRKDS